MDPTETEAEDNKPAAQAMIANAEKLADKGFDKNDAEQKALCMSTNEYLEVYKIYRAYIMEESALVNARLTWIITINGFLFASFGLSLQKNVEILRYYADTQQASSTGMPPTPSPKLKNDASDAAPSPSSHPAKEGIVAFVGAKHVPWLLFNDAVGQTEIFLLTISTLGIFIGVLGFLAIRAAQNASRAVLEIFENHHIFSLHQIKVGDIKDNNNKLRCRNVTTYTTEDGRVFPSIRGGGSKKSLRFAYFPSLCMPILFVIGWTLSLLFLLSAARHNYENNQNILDSLFGKIIWFLT